MIAPFRQQRSPLIAALFRRWFPVALLALALGAVPVLQGGDAPKDSDCLLCHEDNTLAATNAAGAVKQLYVDAARLKASIHATNSCVACHRDLTDQHPDDNVPARPVACAQCHASSAESYGASVHGQAARNGEAGAPACQDCHGSHEVQPPRLPASPLHFSRLAQTCGSCHDQEAQDVAASVHGRAAAAGQREAATCTDCHAEHRIEQLKTNANLHISGDICAKCHASERINTKFKLPRDRVLTFFQSYHGLASQYGSTLAANCSSCHGYHKVLPSADPASTIHTNHLVATCGKCHPGATTNFALGKIHVNIEASAKEPGLGLQINGWVRRVYLWLIVVVIGSMAVHNLLVFARKCRVRYQAMNRPVVRMDASQRWQHFLLLASFIVLAVTGFALKWPDSWVAGLLGSHEDFRRWAHRLAGVVLLLAGAYHVFYVIAAREGRRLVQDMLPAWQDLREVGGNLAWMCGLKPEKPRLGRFGYVEKAEYWAVVWGTIIMGVTGLVIWFKMEVTVFLPRWAVDVATTIHYYEAILACLSIVVWHFYHVLFDPDVYPLNMAAVDGRVTEHWMKEEHPCDPSAPAGQPAPPEGKKASGN